MTLRAEIARLETKINLLQGGFNALHGFLNLKVQMVGDDGQIHSLPQEQADQIFQALSSTTPPVPAEITVPCELDMTDPMLVKMQQFYDTIQKKPRIFRKPKPPRWTSP